MFQLHDIRKTRVWQEAIEEGQAEGKALLKKEMVEKWLKKGLSHKEIAELLEAPLEEVRRLAKKPSS